MKIEKTDIIHSLYNATNVGWDEVNNKWLASDANGNAINVVSADVDTTSPSCIGKKFFFDLICNASSIASI